MIPESQIVNVEIQMDRALFGLVMDLPRARNESERMALLRSFWNTLWSTLQDEAERESEI